VGQGAKVMAKVPYNNTERLGELTV